MELFSSPRKRNRPLVPAICALMAVLLPVAACPAAEKKTAEERIQRVVNYLTDLYAKPLDSPDWITRSVATISLARLPGEEITSRLVEQVTSETQPVARLVAWQALLGRASALDEKQHARWAEATETMARQDLFHGDLRMSLLEFLAAGGVKPNRFRAAFRTMFEETNSLDSADIPTLLAMGKTLRWTGDERLVRWLIAKLRDPRGAIRAQFVLQAAGAEIPWQPPRKAPEAFDRWWRDAGEAFGAGQPGKEPWKKLEPQYIPAPIELKVEDLHTRKWLNELELPRFTLEAFDFAIAMDCSRSMNQELERLRRDMGVMFTALHGVAREPRIGLTLFAPGNTVVPMPVTGSTRRLARYLQETKIIGPAGDEEWAGALARTIKESKWVPPGEYARRVIVLISDEPITRAQYERAIEIARQAGKNGFRIYGVKVRGRRRGENPLRAPYDEIRRGAYGGPPEEDGKRNRRRRAEDKPTKSWEYYDKIAEATGVEAIEVRVPKGGMGVEVGDKSNRGRVRHAVAPLYPGGGPTARILTMVLVDAINPTYSDRIEPLVKTLVAYSQKAAEHRPERRSWR